MLSRPEIQAAAARLLPHVRRTPMLQLQDSDLPGVPAVALKMEFLQHTGSFKPRGAFNRMLTAAAPPSGVVAASGGNHGAAVAFAARSLVIPATIFVPVNTPSTKVARIESYGAKVVQGGAAFADAYEACQARQAQTGALDVHAYDDPAVLAGQGTVALEVDQDSPGLTHLLVAVGGGGLIGGIAAWFAGSATHIVAVEPASCPSLHAAQQAGHPVPVQVGGIAADSLGARQVGRHMFEITRAAGVASVLVSDDAIRAAQRLLWDRLRLVAEPGGATALAALLSGAWIPPAQAKIGVVLCGANTNPALFS